jgi:hypothetical protein
MPQNPKVFLYQGGTQNVDYTPPSVAVNQGDVLILGNIAHFSQTDIAALAKGSLAFSGAVWKGNKAAGAWVLNAPVYYDTAASPNVGTAATGAFTQTPSSTATLVGYCEPTPGTSPAAAALTGDQFGYFVKANPAVGGSGTSAVQSVAATGSTVADASALVAGFNLVTGADGTKGSIIPAASSGKTIRVKNSDAANAILKVYPPTGGTINALSANAAISMAAKTACSFESVDGLAWFTIPLLPS